MKYINTKLGTTLTTVNITKYYKGPNISGLKSFNHLPLNIKSLANDMKSFKTSLKRFLYHHCLYSIEEYYEYNDDKGMYILTVRFVILILCFIDLMTVF
jgi:hypothetical protein